MFGLPNLAPTPLEQLPCEFDEVSTLVKQENQLSEQVAAIRDYCKEASPLGVVEVREDDLQSELAESEPDDSEADVSDGGDMEEGDDDEGLEDDELEEGADDEELEYEDDDIIPDDASAEGEPWAPPPAV